MVSIKKPAKNPSDSTRQRFFAKVLKTRKCWYWRGPLYPYGHFTWRGISINAHRMAWILEYGEIPKDFCVLHQCDRPECVKPTHLFLGTQEDNMADCSAKGRAPGQKLKPGDKEKIIEMAREPHVHQIDVAKKFGISARYVRRLMYGV